MKTAIFDFDGVIIDSFETVYKIFKKIFNEMNLEFPRHFLLERFGKGPKLVITEYLEENNIEYDDTKVDELVQKKTKLHLEANKQNFLNPGVEELINALDKIALASSNTKDCIIPLLTKNNILNKFKVLVTKDIVKEAKPAPDLFLEASKQMNTKPEDCVVIEDSIYGLRAAKNAGMKTIALITCAFSKEQLEKENPDLIVDSLNEIEKIKEVFS